MIKPMILYVCDRKACKDCSPDCNHTSNINHAANFKNDDVEYPIGRTPVYVEKTTTLTEESKFNGTQTKIDFDKKMRQIRYEVSEEFRDEMKKEFNPEASHFSLEYIFHTLDKKCEAIKKGEKHE